jgi:hypothetical protein
MSQSNIRNQLGNLDFDEALLAASALATNPVSFDEHRMATSR